MTNICEYKFSDLYEMSSGISSKPEQAGHGSPFVSFSTVFNNFFLPDKLNELMDTSEREQEIYSLKAGDILLTRTSETIDELGMSCVVLRDYSKATFSGFVKRLRPRQENITYPRYMGFYLRSKFFRKTMTNNAVLTLRASLNEEIFSYLKLYLPDYQTQKRIGDFLYSLNKKIALNNHINAELEAMAKTIYDYWFVQFDFPISKEQAKGMGKPRLEGKPYKASGGKMVWSEELKRDVPEGWDVMPLRNICELYQPKTISENEMIKDGNFLVFGANGIVGRYDKYNHEDSEIVITCRGNSCGNIIRTRPKSWITGNAMVVKPLGEKISREFIFQTLTWANISSVITGSAQPQITRTNLSPLRVIIPQNQILSAFDDLTSAGVQKQLKNLEENDKLSALRDWLLPMLMNSQVKIKKTIYPKIFKPGVSESKPTNSYFYQTQLVSAIVNASKKHKITHGEMTLAKYTYFVDKLYGVPTYFNYERLHLGPYPKEMKKIVNNKKFFKIKNNEVLLVPQKKEYKYQFQKQVDEAVEELASIFSQYKRQERSHQTELLATVCKVVEDIKSTDLKAVRESMRHWPIDLKTSRFNNKAEKFSDQEVAQTLELIIKHGWQNALIK
jgi:type I restriction enzyme S subunit